MRVETKSKSECAASAKSPKLPVRRPTKNFKSAKPPLANTETVAMADLGSAVGWFFASRGAVMLRNFPAPECLATIVYSPWEKANAISPGVNEAKRCELTNCNLSDGANSCLKN
jgi:hypothetical protein